VLAAALPVQAKEIKHIFGWLLLLLQHIIYVGSLLVIRAQGGENRQTHASPSTISLPMSYPNNNIGVVVTNVSAAASLTPSMINNYVSCLKSDSFTKSNFQIAFTAESEAQIRYTQFISFGY
jgi:hypothetical protein